MQSKKFLEISEMMESHSEILNGEENNPWSVADIEHFLYFCCPECEVKDQSKESFIEHAFNHHPKAKEYLLQLQIKKENDDDIIPEDFDEQDSSYFDYMTPKCEIKSESKENDENGDDIYDEDQNNYLLEKSEKHQCLECSKEFKSPWHLKRHTEGVHKGIRHKCDMCEKSFSQTAFLKKHKKDAHNWTDNQLNNSNEEKKKEFQCELCSKGFDSAWHYKRHTENVHEGIRYNCDLCEQSYSQVYFLKKHKKEIHDVWDVPQPQLTYDEDGNIKEFHCPVCYKNFDSAWHLKRHNESVHEGIRYKCDLCEQSYRYCLRIR